MICTKVTIFFSVFLMITSHAYGAAPEKCFVRFLSLGNSAGGFNKGPIAKAIGALGEAKGKTKQLHALLTGRGDCVASSAVRKQTTAEFWSAARARLTELGINTSEFREGNEQQLTTLLINACQQKRFTPEKYFAEIKRLQPKAKRIIEEIEARYRRSGRKLEWNDSKLGGFDPYSNIVSVPVWTILQGDVGAVRFLSTLSHEFTHEPQEYTYSAGMSRQEFIAQNYYLLVSDELHATLAGLNTELELHRLDLPAFSLGQGAAKYSTQLVDIWSDSNKPLMDRLFPSWLVLATHRGPDGISYEQRWRDLLNGEYERTVLAHELNSGNDFGAAVAISRMTRDPVERMEALEELIGRSANKGKLMREFDKSLAIRIEDEISARAVADLRPQWAAFRARQTLTGSP